MNSWDPLVRAALLGTHREQLPHDSGPPGVKELLDRLPDSRPAHRLLSAAGTQDLYEQVGRTPERALREMPVYSIPEDDRPLCNPQAAYYLSRMLAGPYRTLLPEFLEALFQSGFRIPEITLPNLLAHGARVVAIRPIIMPLLSARDRQLAAGNPAWSYASPDMDSWAGLRRIWDTLPPINRQSLVKQLRVSSPELGRELLESTWKIDQDSQRMRLLKMLETGLTLNDEPFLETALDDRNQQIRRRAAELLAYLPESRLAQRMTKRVQRYLTWSPDQERPINVRFLPVSPSMVRDGVFGSKSKSAARVRAQELIQIVGAVPLAHWTAEWSASPQTILQAVINTNWTRTLFAGLTWAAFRQKNATWANEIISIRGLEGATNKLVDLLSPEDFAQLIKKSLPQENSQDPFDRHSPLITALHRRTHPFDTEMVELLLPIYAMHFSEDNKTRPPGSIVRSSFLKIARTCPTELAGFAAGQLKEIAPQWQSTVNEFLSILKFRREMLETVISSK